MLKKLQVIFLYLFILTLPFNLRHIFNFSVIQNINGFREHLAVSFFLFDLPIITLLTLMLVENYSHIFTKKTLFTIVHKPIFYFVLFLLITFPFTSYTPTNWYNLIRLLEAIFLFIASRQLLRQHTVLIYSKLFLFIGGVIQGIIAIMQFAYQKSIGLTWLGESIIAPNVHSVAKFTFEGEKFIRSYGTFPHPNVLGIFLLLSLSAGLGLILSKKRLTNNLRWQYRLIFLSEFIIIFIGILLTYSRAIIAFTGLILVVFALSQRKFINRTYKQLCAQLHIPFFLQTTIAILIIFGGLFMSYNLIAPRLCIQCADDQSMSFRKAYQQTAELIILKHPFIGIGLGNFVPISKYTSENTLSSWRVQPVHNLYLLVASEIGLIGLFLFLLTVFYYLIPRLRLQNILSSPLDLFFLTILIIAFFDHYFWTLPQGQLIFWLSLALASIPKTRKIDSPKYHFKPILKNVRNLLKELS